MNKVSIIVPIYNLGHRLEPALSSVAAQTYGDVEIIVVDDCSSDDSRQRARRILEESGKEHRIIIHDANLGVSTSRNDGLRAADGEYVVFIDGDDMIEPNFISELLGAIESSHADYAACGYRRFETGSGTSENHFLDVPAGIGCDDILAGRILNKIEISHCATLYRRSFLLENNLLYTKGSIAGEDIEFLIKMLCHRPQGVFIRDCLYVYVQHENMGSRKGVSEKAGKLLRYEHHTEAHFREAEYIARHTNNKKLAVLANNLLLPLAYLRRMSVFAMKGDEAGFYEIARDSDVRKTLLRSYRSIMYKPEVFLRSLIALRAPSLYYKKYNHYLDR